MPTPTIKHSRLLAAADIHGYKDELSLLLKEANYNPLHDQLILLGDYIDADDPATWGTLDTVRQLAAEGALVLPGNQELRLLANMEHQPSFPSGTLQWLEQLPLYIVEENFLFVHAGLRPGIPLNKQSAKDLTEIRDDFINQPLAEHDEALAYVIIFGHTPTFKLGAPAGELWAGNRRLAIDTGAKHGCRLSLLDVGQLIRYSCSTAAHSRGGDLRRESLSHPFS
ncbi:metallophosphoesterase [Paenibacillus paridis]|uniref:metallophosphoesterase n=1 Tax=Paenibacillus paridis TaxID=2583376 RepID=UPI001390A1F5|nr:metallophosphoesterase [Paenibacillus paridis]